MKRSDPLSSSALMPLTSNLQANFIVHGAGSVVGRRWLVADMGVDG